MMDHNLEMSQAAVTGCRRALKSVGELLVASAVSHR